MRIGLQTWGTEGDVRPFIALAAGLAAAGHEVTLAVTEIRNSSFSEYGTRFGFSVLHPGHIDVSEEEYRAIGRRMVASASPALKSRLLVSNFLNPVLDDMYRVSEQMCSRCDLVIGHLFAYPLRAAAERACIPWVSLYTTPVMPSSAVAPPGLPEFAPSAGWKVFETALNLLWKPDINKFFMEKGLRKPRSIFRDVFFSDVLNLVSVSPSLYPGGGVDGYNFCGEMEIPEEKGMEILPPGLEEFLSDGEPPVFFTFGSMFFGEMNRIALVELLKDAAKEACCRAVIQAGTGLESSEGIFFLSRALHSSVFPRCAAVVHHGGCGTSHTACASGVPSVIVEYTADQPLWGRLLKMAGVAPSMLHRRSLTSKKLAAAIQEVLWSSSYSVQAKKTGYKMKEEKGVSTAVNLIETKLGG